MSRLEFLIVWVIGALVLGGLSLAAVADRADDSAAPVSRPLETLLS